MKSFKEYLERKKSEFGKKFNPSDLSKQFIVYFENQYRIEIKTSCGEIKRGRIGVTTGWKPCFLLMLTTRSRGSSWTLSDNDIILNVVSYY